MPEPENVTPIGKKPYREIGTAGNSKYHAIIMEDYNPDLRGGLAIEAYDRMRRNDAKVKASLRIVKTPLLAGQWYVDSHTHGESAEGKRAAEFGWWALNSMNRPFVSVLSEILAFLDFGFYPFEVVYEESVWEGKEVIKWKKWGPRHPKTLIEWDFNRYGEASGMVQAVEGGDVKIPMDKMLLFTFDEEGGNPEGTSLLRSAYQHWFYKERLYKIDAIQKERHGIGIPDIELPENATENDKKYARELGKNLRTNEESFILRPHGMSVGFVRFEGQPVDVLASAKHHDLMIAANVLAQFLNLGSSDTGSRAISESQQDIFTKAVRYIADLVRGVINRELRTLLAVNGFDPELCEFKVRRIGDAADYRALSVAIRNLVEPGVLTADPELEHFFREIMDLPHGNPAVMARGIEERLPQNKREDAGEDDEDGDEPREGSRTGGPKE